MSVLVSCGGGASDDVSDTQSDELSQKEELIPVRVVSLDGKLPEALWDAAIKSLPKLESCELLIEKRTYDATHITAVKANGKNLSVSTREQSYGDELEGTADTIIADGVGYKSSSEGRIRYSGDNIRLLGYFDWSSMAASVINSFPDFSLSILQDTALYMLGEEFYFRFSVVGDDDIYEFTVTYDSERVLSSLSMSSHDVYLEFFNMNNTGKIEAPADASEYAEYTPVDREMT